MTESFDRDARSLLQRAGAILASSLDIGETLRAIPPLLVPSFADTCTLYLREGDELAPVARAVARAGDDALLQELHSMPRTPRAGLREALETGRAVVHQKLDLALLRAIDPVYAEVVQRLETHSSLCVPLGAGEEVLGVIALGYSRPGASYSGEEAALVEELGRRAGLAVRHARLFRDASRLAERLRRMQRVTSELGSALTPAQVAQIVVQHGREALSAFAGALVRFDESGRMHTLAAQGYPPDAVARYEQFSAEPDTPEAAAVRAGAPVFLGPWHEEKDPVMRARREPLKSGGFVALPLLVDGKAEGALLFSFKDDHRFDGEEKEFALSLAAQSTQAWQRTRLFEQVRGAQQLLQTSLEQLPAGVVIVDANGRVLEMNAEVQRLFGDNQVPDSIAGYVIARGFRLDGTQYAPAGWPVARALLTGEVVQDEEATLQRPDGSRVAVRMSAARLPGKDGTRMGAVASFFDFSAQRRARERQAFLAEAASLLSESLDASGIFERLASLAVPRLADSFVVQIANASGSLEPVTLRAADPELMRTAIERGAGSARPRSVLEQVFETGKPALVPEITEEVLASGPHDAPTLAFLRKAGFRSAMFVPLSWRGKSLGVLGFGAAESRRGFDAADLSLAEDLARRASLAMENARLYQESERNRLELTKAGARLAELLQKEQAARRQAEEATRLKDDFLAVLSHEMRTPLSSILGWTGMLKLRGQIPEELSHAIATIDRNARSQLQIVEDLLDISRIVSGKSRVTLSELDPAGVARAAVEVVAPAARAKGVELASQLAAGLTVRGDEDRLQQVLWNLLTNAIKFTPAGGHVTLRLDASASGVQLSVRDDGAGIPPEFLPHLFSRFRQAQPALTRAEGGLGLGLAIARHLVELHGGTIRGASDGPGRGSLFVVELPRAGISRAVAAVQPPREQPPPAASRSPVSREALRGRGVLVVEDDADARELLALTLMEFGAKVETAANAALGMEALQAGSFEVLISDISMPGEDGYSFVRRARAAGFSLPAVALTANARREDRDRALAAGFGEHLTKPIEPLDLVAVLLRVLQG